MPKTLLLFEGKYDIPNMNVKRKTEETTAVEHPPASNERMDAFRVQKWMGHKNIATTQQCVTLYGADLHPLADALDKRREDAHAFVSRSVQIEGAVIILNP